MDAGTVVVKFIGDDKDLKSKTDNISSSVKGLTKSITIGNLAAKGISKAFSLMSGSMDQAITRVDTMNNFPNVMKNLGVSSKDSQKAIDKLSDKLQGLPTTLDSGARAVQRFTSANGNVAKSTDMFLSLNNALLAGGASAETQASALEQISQAYAKGRPDMIEWRSVLTAMPAQAKQLGMAFGMSSDQLGEALRRGDISMDDFMNKVVELNEKGVAGFDSFSVQASRATGGIQTSITNLKTAIARGLANVLNGLNDSLSEYGGIAGVTKSITNQLNKMFTKLAEAMKKIPWKNIIKAFKIMAPIIVTIVGAIATYNTVTKIATGITTAFKVAMVLLNTALKLNPIGLVVTAIIGLIAGLVLLYNKCTWFRNMINGLFQFIKSVFNVISPLIKASFNLFIESMKLLWTIIEPIVNLIGKKLKKEIDALATVLKWLWTNIVSPVFNWIKDHIVKQINNCVTMFKVMRLAIQLLEQKIKNIWASAKDGFNKMKNAISSAKNSIVSKVKDIASGIVNAIKGSVSKMKEIGKQLIAGLWQGMKDKWNKVKDKVADLGDKVTKKLKSVFGIKSPSKVFAEIGRYNILGLQKGMEDSLPQLQNSIDRMFNLSPSVTSTMNNSMSPTIVVNNDINMSTDPLGQVVSKIKTYQGGARNDFNYGKG